MKGFNAFFQYSIFRLHYPRNPDGRSEGCYYDLFMNILRSYEYIFENIHWNYNVFFNERSFA